MASLVSIVANRVPDLFFTGFYVVDKKSNNLLIGPYQSTIIATPRIEKGRGVCGTAWLEEKTQVNSSNYFLL